VSRLDCSILNPRAKAKKTTLAASLEYITVHLCLPCYFGKNLMKKTMATLEEYKELNPRTNVFTYPVRLMWY